MIIWFFCLRCLHVHLVICQWSLSAFKYVLLNTLYHLYWLLNFHSFRFSFWFIMRIVSGDWYVRFSKRSSEFYNGTGILPGRKGFEVWYQVISEIPLLLSLSMMLLVSSMNIFLMAFHRLNISKPVLFCLQYSNK